MTGKTKRREKRLKIDFGRFSAFALGMALLLGPFPWGVALAEEAEPTEIVEEPETPGEVPDGTAPQVKIVLTEEAGAERVWEDRREEIAGTLFLREPGTLRVEAEDDETPQEELQIELLRVEKEDGK